MYRMLTIFMFCLAATWSVSAQTAPVPDKYEIETAADCARYNDDVLRCAEWLRTTPYDPTKSDDGCASPAFSPDGRPERTK